MERVAPAFAPDEQDALFRPEGYAEVRITVHLPGANTDSGTPEVFGYTQLMLPEEIRIQHPRLTLPPAIERAAKSLMLSMRFR